jgi:hypothetical protein
MSAVVSTGELLDALSDETVRDALDRFPFLAVAEKLLPK